VNGRYFTGRQHEYGGYGTRLYTERLGVQFMEVKLAITLGYNPKIILKLLAFHNFSKTVSVHELEPSLKNS